MRIINGQPVITAGPTPPPPSSGEQRFVERRFGKRRRTLGAVGPAEFRAVWHQPGRRPIELSRREYRHGGSMAGADDRQNRGETSPGAMPVERHQFEKSFDNAKRSTRSIARWRWKASRWWKPRKSILIVPEGKEPRMTPEVMDGNRKGTSRRPAAIDESFFAEPRAGRQP